MIEELLKRVELLENRVEELEKSGPKSKFQKPTIQDVHGYMREKLSGTDGFVQTQSEMFMNHYTSNGWKVGKVAMKDWKAAVRNWITNIKNRTFNADNTRTSGEKPVQGDSPRRFGRI